jgi:hypothetical protein
VQAKPYTITAVAEYNGEKYTQGFNTIGYTGLRPYPYYLPATYRTTGVDVKTAPGLKVGYVMGTGDDVAKSMEDIGIHVNFLSPQDIASGNLSQYDAIVLGIRAYDTQKELIANNKKLLDYVHDGGTLIVQYNAGVGDFNSGHFTPYPAQISRTRVSVEEAPVQILAPEDKLFHFPNEITQRDFDGWVQERGLNFMDQWDNQYKPLLACQDPGEAFQKGGMLRAQYGKGTYIYTGYAFFRQLPAGVPGAIRLYVNLLSQ